MINGSLINYYFHCKRQCYLAYNRLNLEDNSELVKIGRAIHQEKELNSSNAEIKIDNIVIDRLTKEYITEIKKSDADVEASKWQLLYYLYVLKTKGLKRKGRLEFVEKKNISSNIIVELNDDNEKELIDIINKIEALCEGESIPEIVKKPACMKCAYYEYCYI